MTSFLSIFISVLGINIAVTTLSSDWYKKWKASRNSNSTNNGSISPSHHHSIDDGSNTVSVEHEKKWKLLLQRYLIVYLLATLSDWMQGPYVYALYRDGYGYEQHDIAVLFVAGFGSSMIFGSFIGGMADTGGRRTFVILFSIIYAFSCFTKHFKNFTMLMIGRLLGGIATSLLFSVFDSWLIRAHTDANLPKNYISKSFSWAQYGNSIIAILAGLLANNAASTFDMKPIVNNFLYIGGFIGPFDLAAIALIICGICASTLWEENYGTNNNNNNNSSSSSSNNSSGTLIDNTNDESTTGGSRGINNKCYDGLKGALTTSLRSTDIMLCGAISSLFEGSMYIFVFMWTPALTSGADSHDSNSTLPFGLIFSTFMVCCMVGSSIFSIQIEKMKGEELGVRVYAVAAIAMFVIAFSSNPTYKFLSMNLFEMTVGMYFPIMGTLKGTIVPESQRSAIYNLFRIPLNFIVLFSLLTDLTPSTSFLLNGIMLSTATGLQYWLMKRRQMMGNTSSTIISTSDNEKEKLVSSNSTELV